MLRSVSAAAALPSLALALVMLGGCKAPSPQPPAPDAVLAGSTFVSTRSLTVPAGATEVILQDGGVLLESGIQPDYPYCRFRPAGATTAARTAVPPAVYTVSTLEYDQRGARRGSETRPVVWFVLQGGAQNAGGRMGCAVPFAGPDRLYLTPAEVQGAVGGYFNVNAAR